MSAVSVVIADKKTLDSVNEKVTTVKTDVTEVKGTTSAVKTDVTTVKTDVTEVKGTTTTVKGKVDEIAKKATEILESTKNINTTINNHIKDEANPHKVTAEQVDAYNKNQINNGLFEEVPVTMTGIVVSTDMVSPVEHNIKCRVERMNLIPYPYHETTKTENGVTFTDNGDGSITIDTNGKSSSEQATFKLSNYTIILEKDSKYIISADGCNENIHFYVGSMYSGWTDNWAIPHEEEHVKVHNPFITGKYMSWITIAKGTVVNNVTIHPMFQKGFIATPYVPYVSDLSNDRILLCGYNLIRPNIIRWKFNEQSDGSYKCIENDVITYKDKQSFILPSGIYTFSVDIKCKKDENYQLRVVYSDETEGFGDQPISTGEYMHQTWTTNGKPIKQIFFGHSDYGNDLEYKNLQCVYGNKELPYQESNRNYLDVSADGSIVQNIKSVSPYMSFLFSDGGMPDRYIEATYNADVSKYTANQPLTSEQMLEAEKLKLSKKVDISNTSKKLVLGEDEVGVYYVINE